MGSCDQGSGEIIKRPTIVGAPTQAPEDDTDVIVTVAPTVEGEAVEAGFFLAADGTITKGYQNPDGTVAQVPFTPKQVEKERLQDMGLLAARLQDLIAAQRNPELSDEQVEAKRSDLREQYAGFITKHGRILEPGQNKHGNTNRALLGTYRQALGALQGLDVFSHGKVMDADILRVRTERPIVPPDNISDPVDALLASINHFGAVRMDYMQQITGQTEEHLAKELSGRIFLDHASKTWVMSNVYLSGDVVRKAEQLRQDMASATERRQPIDPSRPEHDFAVNLDALEEARPQRVISIQDINDGALHIGSPFLPPEVLEGFIRDKVDEGFRGAVRFNSAFKGSWVVSGAGQGSQEHISDVFKGVKYWPWFTVLRYMMEKRPPKVFTYTGADGSTLIDKTTTNKLQDAFNDMQARWEEYLENIEGTPTEEKILDGYNDKVNVYGLGAYDGDGLTFPGLSGSYKLAKHQRDAVMRMILQPSTLLHHAPGAGKTLVMAAAVMKLRQIGVVQRPMIIIPKSIIDDFTTNFLSYFPSAKILTLSSEDVGKREKREQLLAKISTQSWDVVLMPESAMNHMPQDPKKALALLEQQVAAIDKVIYSSEADDLPAASIRQIEKERQELMNEIEVLREAVEKELRENKDPLYFESFGIDALYVDEAHHFKNFPKGSRHGNVRGVGKARSQRALKMALMMDSVHGTGGRTAMATATPISNGMSEAYVFTRMLQRSMLMDNGMENFDSWVQNFGDVKSELVMAVQGGSQLRQVLQYQNVHALLAQYRSFADIVTQQDLVNANALELPTDEEVPTPVEPSDIFKELTEHARERWANMPRRPEPGQDNPLSIFNDLRKLALDVRLYMRATGMHQALADLKDADMQGDKLNVVADNVTKIYKQKNEAAEDRGVQLLFMDLGTPKKQSAAEEVTAESATGDLAPGEPEEGIADIFAIQEDEEGSDLPPFPPYYEVMREALVKRGIPREEIAFIQDARERDDLDAFFRDVNAGKYRIVLGSIPSMGEGINIQERVEAMHMVTLPWRATDLEQAKGRGIRKGNRNSHVRTYFYPVQDSLEQAQLEFIVQKLESLKQLLAARPDEVSAQDVEMASNYSDVELAMISLQKILGSATTQEIYKRLRELEGDLQKASSVVRRLKGKKAAYQTYQRGNASRIEQEREELRQVQEDEQRLAPLKPDEKTPYPTDVRLKNAKKPLKEWVKEPLDTKKDRAVVAEALSQMSQNSNIPENVPIGSFRGFDIYSFGGAGQVLLVPEGAGRESNRGHVIRMSIAEAASPKHGEILLTRIENALTAGAMRELGKIKGARLEQKETRLARLKEESDKAEGAVGEAELKLRQMTNEKNELNERLHKENTPADGAPGTGSAGSESVPYVLHPGEEGVEGDDLAFPLHKFPMYQAGVRGSTSGNQLQPMPLYISPFLAMGVTPWYPKVELSDGRVVSTPGKGSADVHTLTSTMSAVRALPGMPTIVKRATTKKEALADYVLRTKAIRVSSHPDAMEIEMHEYAHHLELGVPGFQRLWDQTGARMIGMIKKFSYTNAADQVRSEGFAETFRLWSTNYPALKAKAPSLARWMDTEFRDIYISVYGEKGYAKLLHAQEELHRYYYQGSHKRGVAVANAGRWMTKQEQRNIQGPRQNTAARRVTRIAQKLTNWHAGLYPYMHDMGLNVEAASARNPITMATILGGSTTAASAWLSFGQARAVVGADGEFDVETIPGSKGLLEIIDQGRKAENPGERDLSIEEIFAGLAAMRLDNLHKLGKKGPSELLNDKLFHGMPQDQLRRVMNTAVGVKKFYDNLLNFMVQAGAVTPDQAEAMSLINPLYTPLYRFFPHGHNHDSNARRKDLPRVSETGSERPLADMEEALVRDVMMKMHMSFEALFNNSLIHSLKQGPSDVASQYMIKIPEGSNKISVPRERMAKTMREEMERIHGSPEAVLKAFAGPYERAVRRIQEVFVQFEDDVGVAERMTGIKKSELGDHLGNLQFIEFLNEHDTEGSIVGSSVDISERLPQVFDLLVKKTKTFDFWFSGQKPHSQDHEILTVVRNGEREYYEVVDQDLVDMMRHIAGRRSDFLTAPAMQAIYTTTRGMSRLVTMFPGFFLAAFAKDVMVGPMSIVHQDGSKGGALNAYGGMVSGVVRNAKSFLTTPDASKNIDHLNRWFAGGSLVGRHGSTLAVHSNKNPLYSLFPVLGKREREGILKAGLSYGQESLRKWDIFLSGLEDLPRYQAARKQLQFNGVENPTNLQLAATARQIFGDFARTGTAPIAQSAMLMENFMRAIIAGKGRFMHQIMAADGTVSYSNILKFGATTKAKIMWYGMVLSATLGLLSWATSRGCRTYIQTHEDRAEVRVYWDPPETPDATSCSRGYVSVPVPHAYGYFFLQGPQLLLNKLVEDNPDMNDRDWESFTQWVFHEATAIVWEPSAVMPIIQQIGNRDFAGRPIVTRGMGGVPEDQEYWYTPLWAKRLGDKMSASPARLASLSRAYLRTLSDYMSDAAEMVMWDEEQFGEMPFPTWHLGYLAGDFVPARGRIPPAPHVLGSFYDMMVQVRDRNSQLSSLEKALEYTNKDPRSANLFADELEEVKDLRLRLKQINVGLQDVTNTLRRKGLGSKARNVKATSIKHNPKLTREEKEDQINELFLEYYAIIQQAWEGSKQVPGLRAQVEDWDVLNKEIRAKALELGKTRGL